MCGRYTLASPPSDLVEAFDVPLPDFDLAARYNIAPGQSAPVVAQDRRGRRVGLLTWGLVPGWMDEPGKGLVNARAETVGERPSYREAFERRRCLVPADGFYEWKGEGGAKTPYWFRPAAGGLLSFAGIWERWSRPDAEPRHTFAILTVDAGPDVADIHDRMPAIVPAHSRDAWLGRDASPQRLRALLAPSPEGTLERRAVSRRVNRTDEDDEGLIEEAG